MLCQVPSGAIVHSSDSETYPQPLFDFDHVKNYVIPKPQLCNKLVTIEVDSYRVVGHPIQIVGNQYERNSFIFNFAFVFPAGADSVNYEVSIRRLARMFMALEEQSNYLSKASDIGIIENIIEQIYQDINNYSECMIPIDDSNTVNMKLFPLIPTPPGIEPYYVPVSTVRLAALIDENWDPTMEKIVPYINGINSVRRIADLADADYDLTKECIQHLMHYKCIVLLDIFQFSNIYAVTSDIHLFLTDPSMFAEFQSYVYRPSPLSRRTRLGSHSVRSGTSTTPLTATTPGSVQSNLSSSAGSGDSRSRGGSLADGAVSDDGPPDLIESFALFRKLHQGITVGEWYVENIHLLRNIDVRRFVSFGVIKGLIYRVQSYPISEASPHSHLHSPFHQYRFSVHHRRSLIRRGHDSAEAEEIDDLVQRITHQPAHFDAICTHLRRPKSAVQKILQKAGDWTIINA